MTSSFQRSSVLKIDATLSPLGVSLDLSSTLPSGLGAGFFLNEQLALVEVYASPETCLTGPFFAIKQNNTWTTFFTFFVY